MWNKDFSDGEAFAIVLVLAVVLISGAVGMGFLVHRASATFVSLAVEAMFLIYCASQPE